MPRRPHVAPSPLPAGSNQPLSFLTSAGLPCGFNRQWVGEFLPLAGKPGEEPHAITGVVSKCSPDERSDIRVFPPPSRMSLLSCGLLTLNRDIFAKDALPHRREAYGERAGTVVFVKI